MTGSGERRRSRPLEPARRPRSPCLAPDPGNRDQRSAGPVSATNADKPVAAAPPPPPTQPPAALPSAAPVEKKAEAAASSAPKPVAIASFCSDTARRPLADRIVVWSNRLRRAVTSDDLIARYDTARSSCELSDFRAQAALLDLIQAKVRTEGAAEALLKHFAEERETQKYIAQRILRRSVDPKVVAVVRRRSSARRRAGPRSMASSRRSRPRPTG